MTKDYQPDVIKQQRKAFLKRLVIILKKGKT